MSSTALDALGADRNVVAARINGRLMDLATPIAEADDVEPVLIDSEEGPVSYTHLTLPTTPDV